METKPKRVANFRAKPCRACGLAFTPKGQKDHHCSAACILSAKTERKPSGCLIWTGLKTPKGYGSVRVDGRLWRTHRLAWELTKGPIPEGLLLRHTCDMPACVELDHLELGTAAENTADMLERNRARRGESCSWAKMSDALVTEIRSRLSPPRYGLVRDLAAEYGLDPSIISMIREGRKWSHITGGVALPAYGKKRHAPA